MNKRFGRESLAPAPVREDRVDVPQHGTEKSKTEMQNRREFLGLTLAALAAECTVSSARPSAWINDTAASTTANVLGENVPRLPLEKPLDWPAMANAFHAYVADPSHGIGRPRPDGTQYFISALEGKNDGGLTTFGPLVLGSILRGENVSQVAPSLAAYFSEAEGVFLDGPGADLCEYWYMMNVNALAFGIIRTHFAGSPEWKSKMRRSADRLIQMAHQLHYDFNDQGYDFKKEAAFTHQDIYRQPDTIGGYAYVMLFAWEVLRDAKYRDEAREGMQRYLAFAKNPWYEVPSGAMAVLAAARLSAEGADVDVAKALRFLFDDKVGLMRAGQWGGKEVNALMAGFSTEPPDQAYSMESMVVLPYLLPVVRYRPEFAAQIGRYTLNVAANMRWFFPEYLPKENQSRPDLPAIIPYERLSLTEKGKTPYATGDFDGHRSIYGGAYILWLGELIRPTADPFLLKLDVSKSDFLDEKSYPTFLYYNPQALAKSISLDVGHAPADLYDLQTQRIVSHSIVGKTEIRVPPGEARVLVQMPSGLKRTVANGVVRFGDIPVDYRTTP
jgi:hypothetical protein